MLAAAVGQRRRRDGAARRAAPTSNAKETRRGQTRADVRGGGRTAPTSIDAAARRAAPTSKATTKVVDLAALDPAAGARRGNRGAAGRPQARRAATPKRAAAATRQRAGAQRPAPARRRPRRRAASPASTRPYRYNELVGTQGGLTPLHLRRAPGLRATSAQALLDARRRRQPGERRRRHDARCSSRRSTATSTSRSSCSSAAPTRTWRPTTASTPLYAALNVAVGAQGALPAAARATCSRRPTYLELMKALLDKGADPNARLTQEGLVLGLQLRPARASTRPARRRSGAPPTRATSTR